MELKFRKAYYNETEKNKRGNVYKVKYGYKKMYQMNITEDYFTDDELEVIEQAIKDVKDVILPRLEEEREKIIEARESWDRVEK